ncbi:hypothetical protein BS47DRAFT_27877 [Hydnum rufescens UP504]|uniref:Uncharacterized protein n=1 Tax=Hydnum rufescens UP504 TaxID=1448309 RepID=A0A9P6B7T7_9AGAM|nr:hypothetical protein BS47DRAFT_27877 [Hydnum rufescens UP504]
MPSGISGKARLNETSLVRGSTKKRLQYQTVSPKHWFLSLGYVSIFSVMMLNGEMSCASPGEGACLGGQSGACTGSMTSVTNISFSC